MVHAGSLQLEERVSLVENSFPALRSIIKGFFLDTFSPRRHLLRQMQSQEWHGKLVEAADYAIQLEQYEHAFTLYNRAIADGDWRANLPAAELAESLKDYKRGLQYRLQMEDFAYAGIDAARLGRPEEAQGYWKRLREKY